MKSSFPALCRVAAAILTVMLNSCHSNGTARPLETKMKKIAPSLSVGRLELPLSANAPGVTATCPLRPLADGAISLRLEPGDLSATIAYDLEKLDVNPNDYDEIQVTFKPTGSQVLWSPELAAYPVKDLRRHWYSKIKTEPGEWATARFDLRLDDDGFMTERSRHDLTQRVLHMTLSKRWTYTPNEPTWREVEIKSICFVRHPVKVDFDEFEGAYFEKSGRLGYTYTLSVFNSTLKPQDVHVHLDTAGLKIFSAGWREKRLTIAPRSTVKIPLTIATTEDDPAKLPPLYSESVQVFAQVEGSDAPAQTPLSGYRPRSIWATVRPRKRPVATKRDFSGDQKEKLIAAAQKALRAEWGVPLHGPAEHGQSYYNPQTSRKPEPVTWFRHKDPSTGAISSDEKLTAAYLQEIHGINFRRADVLADAYLATDDLRYAVAARDVYVEYARFYPFMRAQGFASTAARSRLAYTSLHTCLGFEQYVRAYAKIRNSPALGDFDRDFIEKNFLVPEMRVMYGHSVEFSNQQVHHFTGYAYGVFALDNYWQLMGEALSGDFGFARIVEQGFSEDGLAHEAGVYHWYTIMPLIHFAKMLEKIDVNVMTPRFKRVFDGTVANSPEGVMEDGRLANELLYAYKIWRDPQYIPSLKAHKKWPPDFLSPEAAAHAAEKAGQRLTGNTLMPNIGYLWLREESEHGFRALSINYIQQRDRLEMDRLHVMLYDPRPLSAEVGRITYGDPRSKMMYATVGHNTVVVDQKQQLPLASRLTAFLDRSKMPAALISDDPESRIYPGVSFDRVVAIMDGIFFVGDVYRGEDRHTYDWPFYAPWQPESDAATGVPVFNVGLKPYEKVFDKGPDTAYQFLSDVRYAETDGVLRVGLPITGGDNPRGRPAKMLHMNFAPMEKALVFKAYVPRGYRPQPGPMFFVRLADRPVGIFGCAADVAALEEKSRVRLVENTTVSDIGGGALPPEKAVAWLIRADTGDYVVAINKTGGKIIACGQEIENILAVCRIK